MFIFVSYHFGFVCTVTKQKNSGTYDMEEIILSVQFLKTKLSIPYDSEFFCLNQMVDKVPEHKDVKNF